MAEFWNEQPEQNGFFDKNNSKEIAYRRKMAERLLKQGEQDGTTQIVSGYAVKKSPLEGFAKALASGVGGYQERKADEMQSELDKKRSELMAKYVSAYGQDPVGASQILMQDPEMSGDAMKMAISGMDAQRKAALEEAKWQRDADLKRELAALKEKEWQRDADLKRELAAMRINGSGSMTINPDTGDIEPNPYSEKPLPVGALKMQQEAVDALKAAENTSSLSSKLAQQAISGELNLGPMSNLINRGRNFIGASTPESVNLGLMETDLEKLRNDTLRLNKGVQTEGDAIRAMNEVIQSKNDPQLFAAAMGRLNDINNRAAQMQQMQIDQIRQNYRVAPLNVIGQNKANTNPAINQDYSQIQPVLESDMNATVPQGNVIPPEPMGGIGGQPLSFNSLQEAEQANLPIGTVIIIGGRKAVIE